MRNETTATIRVEATAVGYYNEIFRHVGDVFDLVPRAGRFTEPVLGRDGEPKLRTGTLAQHPIPQTREIQKVLSAADQLNPRWMKKVSADTPVTVHRLSAPKDGVRTQALPPPSRAVGGRSQS